MTGELDWLTILKYYKKTDIFFVQIGKEFTTALPSKIFEYLATGKGLILAAPPGPATDLASTFDGIYTIEPENSAILRKKILSLVTTRDVTYIKNVRIIAEKYLREDQAALFSKIVKDTYYNKFKNNLILDW